MNVSIEFKKFHNKILVHMKTFDTTIDPNLVPFKVPKVGLYVSFRICLYIQACYVQANLECFRSIQRRRLCVVCMCKLVEMSSLFV